MNENMLSSSNIKLNVIQIKKELVLNVKNNDKHNFKKEIKSKDSQALSLNKIINAKIL